MSRGPATLRLDRLLGNLGYGSRREIQALARNGRVSFDGAPLTEAETRLALAADLPGRLSIDGEPVDPPPGLVLVINKPLGVTCSHKDVGPLVFEALPPRWRRRDPALSTVGRLDKESTGLLLLTDDGALLHRIISPKAKILKRYRATLALPCPTEAAAVFAAGTLMLEGEDRPLLPARLVLDTPTDAAVTVAEGRYHQVRRMFAALGNHVLSLHREAVGGFALPPELAPGRYRPLTPAEIATIFVPSTEEDLP